MELFRFAPGRTPLLIDVPHAGTHLPDALASRLTPRARTLPDTDWHVGRLYDFAPTLGAGLFVATHSRYVVDLNRAPKNTALYPGADTTEVCPTTDFERHPLYVDGEAPDADARRPFHQVRPAALLRRQPARPQSRHRRGPIRRFGPAYEPV